MVAIAASVDTLVDPCVFHRDYQAYTHDSCQFKVTK